MNATAPTLFDLDLEPDISEAHASLNCATSRAHTKAGHCTSAIWRWHGTGSPNDGATYVGHLCGQKTAHAGAHGCLRCNETWIAS